MRNPGGEASNINKTFADRGKAMSLFGVTRMPGPNRSIELDFIRGLAIIAVMGFHFHSYPTGSAFIAAIEYPLKNFGHEGVNLFFTLSGFLVGGLLLRQYAQEGRIDAGRFIVRRIFKIWPAYYALILFHVIVGRHPTDTFLVQNLTHMQNYFGSSVAQTWSLAVEEHFYLFLPLLLILFSRWQTRVNTILTVLGAICVAVLIGRSVAVYNGDLEGTFFYTQYRIDSLLFGVMLAAIYWLKPGVYRGIAQRKGLLIAAVAGLVLWLVFGTRNASVDQSIGYTVQAIGYCALIVLTVEYSGRIRGSILYRVIGWIGVYSYGIYLWHSLALAPGDMLIRKAAAWHLPAIPAWGAIMLAQFAIAIVVGYVTTRAIEFPFLRIRDALFPAKRKAEVPEAAGRQA
ncbi:acyltransferase family protein [Caballeronia concitans]|jgi:peptidoglycan/LPS O-acetylase OafA/YrhL|uniref:Acyltransferase family protein n=2 Tax=Caballeronia concitans TaxID=1777133 RepID=A0A658QZ92_9BURK|nr:acyltransferase 3 [Burkholderia sp. MR1]SAL34697.1 acyltransferase family protein [Caballeronia concitans]